MDEIELSEEALALLRDVVAAGGLEYGGADVDEIGQELLDNDLATNSDMGWLYPTSQGEAYIEALEAK